MDERQADLAQAQTDRAISAAIQAAQTALATGAVHLECQDCEEEIPAERRLALPHTRFCFSCAKGREARGRRR